MDRNSKFAKKSIDKYVSLSARRAWIEIRDADGAYLVDSVALRKESVDRNTNWTSIGRPKRVALRKESVDRNCFYS